MADNSLSEGQTWVQSLQDQGLPEATISSMKDQRAKFALSKGYSQDEVDAYFGNAPSKVPAAIASVAKDNLQEAGHDPLKMDTADPNSWSDLLSTGFGTSVLSLEYLGRPTKQLPPAEEMGWFGSFLSSAGQFAGDLPAAITGANAAALGTKNPLLTAYAFGALPEAIRQAYLAHYEVGAPISFIDIIKSVNDAGTINMVGGKAGEIAGKTVTGPVIKKVTEATAMATASTAAAAALNGHLPTVQEFTTGAAFALMFPTTHAMGKAIYNTVGVRGRVELTDAGKQAKARMETLWAKTNIPPTEAARMAKADPVLKQTIMGANADGEFVKKPWEEHAKPEPPAHVLKGAENAPLGAQEILKPLQGAASKEDYLPDAAVRDEAIGAPKPAPKEGEPLVAEPFEAVSKPSEASGISSVKSAHPDQVHALLQAADERAGIVDDPYGHMSKAREATAADLSKKYVNADGSIDIEAALIARHAGDATAKAFRATGRDYSKLPTSTKRYLEGAGAILEEGGYKRLPPPEPKEAPGGGGDGKPPAVPPSGEMAAGAGPGGKGERFPRSPEIMQEILNEKVAPATQGSKWVDTWRAAKSGAWWRELAPATAFDKMVGLTKDEKQIGLEDALRLAYSSSGRTKARIHYGGIKMEPDQVGNPYYAVNKKVRPMADIMTDAAKIDGGIERFRAFLQAKDTVDRAKLGLKTTTPLEDAMEAIAVMTKAEPKLEGLARDFQAMMKDTLQGLKFSGRLNDKQITSFAEKHPNWFPQRVAKDMSDANNRFRSGGKDAGIKKATGHEYNLKDQFLAVIEDIDRREKFNSVNIARRIAVENLKKFFGGESTVRDVAMMEQPKKPGTAVAPEDVAVKHGIVENMSEVKLDDDKFFSRNDNEIVYWEDGQPMTYKVPAFENRKAFMDMIMSPSLVEQDFVKGFFALAAKAERTMIVSTPKFVIRVMTQDAVMSAVLSKYGGIPLWNAAQGVFRIMDHITGGKLNGKAAAEWQRQEMNGGYNISIMDMNASKTLELFHNLDRTGHIDGLVNGYARHPMDMFRQFIRATETMARSTVFANAEKDIGTIKGAIESRMVGGDYAERSAIAQGAAMNTMAALTPFFRANMRSFIDATTRAIVKDPMGVGVRAAAFIGLPSLIFTAYNYWFDEKFKDKMHPSQRYDELSAQNRDVTFQFPFFDAAGNVVRLQAPVPFEMGAAINGAIHRSFAQWMKNDPDAFHGYVRMIMDKIALNNIPVINNPVVKTTVESMTGVDLYTHRTIIPSRMEHLSAKNQAYPWTTLAAKKASAMINAVGGDISPIMIDHLVKGWSGDLGTSIVRTLDQGAGFIPGFDGVNPIKNATDLSNDPWFGSFVARNPGMSAKSVQDFYEVYGKYLIAKADMNDAKKRGDPKALFEASRSADLRIKLDTTARALSKIRTAMYAAENSKTLSRDDKRQLVDKLADQMVKLAQMSTMRFRAVHGGE